MGIEIERKFLITGAVPPQHLKRPRPLEQGYLRDTGGVEIRLRNDNGRRWMTLKGKGNLTRSEWETPLKVAAFKALWPETSGYRITKKRFTSRLDRQKLEIDVYSGDLAGLIVVETEFASTEEARSFVPPPWFGPELTYDARFKNRALAAGSIKPDGFGLTSDPSAKLSIGVIPFVRANGGIKVVVISSRRQVRWIFPKGQPETDLHHRETALLEAHEEAGLEGRLLEPPVLLSYQRDSGTSNLLLYPMDVTSLAPAWKESLQRERRILSLEDAEKLAPQEVLTPGIQVLRDRLGITAPGA